MIHLSYGMRFFILIMVFLSKIASLLGQEEKDSMYFYKLSLPQSKMVSVFNGKYKVFTQKEGSGPTKLLVLHGGPGNTHEYFENFPENLTQFGITVYYYDQLGSYYSDYPDDPSVWDINRFVDEIEEVRKGLELDHFYLLGHSWGGMLAQLYGAKYGHHLKGVILSNIPGFFARDTKYLNSIIDSLDLVVRHQTTVLPKFAKNRAQVDSINRGFILNDTVLFKRLDQQLKNTSDSLFGRTLYYRKAGKMPEPLRRSFTHAHDWMDKYQFNPFGADYKSALRKIKVPVLLVGSKNDFVKPDRYVNLKSLMANAQVEVYICPNGAHFPMWDDTANYFNALSNFIMQVENKSFKPKK
jgi:proline iminopeptidase